MCLVVQQLQELSGFGWDDTRKKVTAEEDVWDNYIAKQSHGVKTLFRSTTI
ncbi:hypothetical protein SERLADRAFT_413111 [Serpula lacrymans var. lacrymans S7.9]|uniref:Myb/SANT-like domain-containing protein n=1 Tax=Serpula lacrymans var. lacrymans (strain S7.9) TaxID=578457 RepID=F8NI25_SERL9|nr:uncharacterized protein SERLADRAFT_413111 [Serpula lacrymans var. lacrymans S7.9]EGO29747.1 hypothetical protein SERLADRAFT_413111 [Serpula lacrymans var. lacrymans S7.9]